MLREIIVNSLSAHPDLEVIELELAGTQSGRATLSEEVDVLMYTSDGAALAPWHEQLLWSRPRMRIVAIDTEGRDATLYELRTHRIAVREPTTETLACVIRLARDRPGSERLEANPNSVKQTSNRPTRRTLPRRRSIDQTALPAQVQSSEE